MNVVVVAVLSSAIPLVDATHELLPIQFSIDPGDREDYGEKLELGQADCVGLLKEYLDILTIDLHVSVGFVFSLNVDLYNQVHGLPESTNKQAAGVPDE